MKFDIVIGNPPYQNSSSKTQTNKLWFKFIEYFFEDTTEYLSFITPDPWTHPESSKSKYKKLFREYQLLYANVGECSKHFPGVGSSFTWFLLKKTKPTIPTVLVTKEVTIEIWFKDWKWIPTKLDKNTIETLNRTLWSNKEKIKYIGSQLPKKYNSKGPDSIFKYPFLLSSSTTSWREEKCKYQDQPKVMFPYLSTHTMPILDIGEKGATHGVNLVFDNIEEAKACYDFYMSDDIQNALKVSKWHHGNMNPQVLKSLPLYLQKSWNLPEEVLS